MSQIDAIDDVELDRIESFDTIIDVRSPSEFGQDHIPSAINLPVLSDAERAEVGTIYKQFSRFRARRIGACYTSANISRHLGTALANKSPDWKPLIYCWRGGMRSNAIAQVLAAVGWRVAVLNGGYQTWRRQVVGDLRDDPVPLRFVLLDGQTGTGKTAVLQELAKQGEQTLDLEGLACHRGSVFGGLAGRSQPSQKLFESHLWVALARMDFAKPIFVEAESSLIGRCALPKPLIQAMRIASRVELRAAEQMRVQYLMSSYGRLLSNCDGLHTAIEALRPFHARQTIDSWHNLVRGGHHKELALALIGEHYDPLYDRSRKKRNDRAVATFLLEELTASEFDHAARRIAATLRDFLGSAKASSSRREMSM
ncbi:MAG: tRNA 2-selenouridine(34) synthase MnmH [Hyphomicrobiaceae bacterium]